MSSKSYFDQVATQWDELREGYFSQTIRDKAFEIAGVQSGRVAADIGAGTGFMTEGLVEQGLSVIAVDQSPAMLDEIKSKFASLGRVECKQGEAEALPLPDGTVDYVFANMTLHHVESPGKAIQEMARILATGGRLVITDLDAHDFQFLRVEQHDRWMGFRREDVSDWMSAAGLQHATVQCANEECCAASECSGERARVSIFIASGCK